MWLRNTAYSLGHVAVIWLFILGVSLAISILLGFVAKVIRFDRFSSWVTNAIMGWAEKTL